MDLSTNIILWCRQLPVQALPSLAPTTISRRRICWRSRATDRILEIRSPMPHYSRALPSTAFQPASQGNPYQQAGHHVEPHQIPYVDMGFQQTYPLSSMRFISYQAARPQGYASEYQVQPFETERIKRESSAIVFSSPTSSPFQRTHQSGSDFSRISRSISRPSTVSLKDYNAVLNAAREYRAIIIDMTSNSTTLIDHLVDFRDNGQLDGRTASPLDAAEAIHDQIANRYERIDNGLGQPLFDKLIEEPYR